MVLNHVADDAVLVKVAAAPLRPERLFEDDLDVRDVVSVPQRRKEAIGEAHHDEVLHKLLPEVMVDPVHLLLRKEGRDVRGEHLRRCEIAPEWLLEHYSHPPASARQMCSHVLTHLGVDRRRERKVKEAVVHGRCVLSLVRVDDGGDRFVHRRRISERFHRRYEAAFRKEPAHCGGVRGGTARGRVALEPQQRPLKLLHERRLVHLLAREPDDEPRRQQRGRMQLE
mmetsp:Transcript_2092/g.7665  ORF Transcript_2092/g.7665 Transcript_2092/m.7665 type:complete len:226 (+) Transcript_2092:1053-1730(+)